MGITIIGSTLAALVAVTRIAEKSEVAWVQTSSRIGGHFSGIELDGSIRDAGMVLLEPFEKFDGTIPDFSAFKKESRHDVRNVIPFAFNWLHGYGIEFNQANVFTNFGGELLQDFYIKDSLDLIRALPDELKKQMAMDIEELNANDASELHPRNKLKSLLFEELSFIDVVNRTLGPTYLREIIAPWANSFSQDYAVAVAAIEHRSTWLPMYFPESISNALNGYINEFENNEKAFMVPSGISVGAAIAKISKQTSQNPRVSVLNSTDYDPGNDENMKIFLGVPDDADSFGIARKEASSIKRERADIAVALFDCFDSMNMQLKDSTVNIHNSPVSLYRYSIREIQSPTRHLELAFEFGNGGVMSDDALETLCVEQISPFFEASVILKKVIRAKFTISTPDSLKIDRDHINQIDSELGNLGITGFTVGPHNSAFNDQLCQGLICAEIAKKGAPNVE
jgi:hypothetical protein